MVMLMLETMLRDPQGVWFFDIFVGIYQSPSRISLRLREVFDGDL
jgi:hypothetical protein